MSSFLDAPSECWVMGHCTIHAAVQCCCHYHCYCWWWWCSWTVNSAGREVWCSQEVKELPCYKLAPLQPDIFASYSGPDSGLTLIHDIEEQSADGSG